MNKSILILPGDGIGPEVVAEARKIFEWFNQNSEYRFTLETGLIGGAAIDAEHTPLPDETLVRAQKVDSILLGAVGGPKWDQLPRDIRPEKGLLKIRKALNLFANLRPATLFHALKDASPLKAEIIRDLDIMIVRELTGDIYFGEPHGFVNQNNERTAFNTMIYSEAEIARVARIAFGLARQRSQKVCSVDKANVLEVSQLWREVVTRIQQDEFADVGLSHMYVDNAAMQLIAHPKQFDVLLTPNLFGDILSDEASMLTGSLGMLPSASFGDTYSLYEPIHGSAPDIAGLAVANPIGTILSVAMMFKYTFKFTDAADKIYCAVNGVLNDGLRTRDIFTEGTTLASTSAMGDAIVQKLFRC
jgi:3-isopropylmalate dehydrogenase